MALVSCTRVVLVVNQVPSNTPTGSQIFVSGNFNLWDPGDNNYQLTMKSDSTYIIDLPRVYGKIEYKFTRGDWSTCEADRCGNDIENRWLKVGSVDTVYNTIESWKDLDPVNCDSITIVVKNIPKNTPKDEPIKIAGSFNAWNPGNNQNYFLKKDSLKNQYVVTVPRKSYQGNSSNILTYKFVRQDISESEVDKFGQEMEPRVLNFEKGDSVYVSIDNWSDMVEPQLSHITIILTKIPAQTPEKDKIYLAGNFNNWNPKDDHYIFTPNKKGLYQIIIPRKKYGLSFKITRGSWDSEFADACGNNFSNQEYNYNEIDTLFYAIEGWKDIKRSPNPFVIFIIDNLPGNTPPTATPDLRLYELNENFTAPVKPFTKNTDGIFVNKVRRSQLSYGFIITRGSYLSQEVTSNGNFINPRFLDNKCVDTVHLTIAKWNDLIADDQQITITITKLPKRTPKIDPIYIVGQFNGWDPGDKDFLMKKNDRGKYSIEVPVRWLKGGFKFTRGNWRKVEGTKTNGYIQNRIYTGNQSQLNIEINGWEDRSLF